MMSMLALVMIRPLQIAKRALNYNHLFFLNTYMFTYSRGSRQTRTVNQEKTESKQIVRLLSQREM